MFDAFINNICPLCGKTKIKIKKSFGLKFLLPQQQEAKVKYISMATVELLQREKRSVVDDIHRIVFYCIVLKL